MKNQSAPSEIQLTIRAAIHKSINVRGYESTMSEGKHSVADIIRITSCFTGNAYKMVFDRAIKNIAADPTLKISTYRVNFGS
jgi:hypothetical protein